MIIVNGWKRLTIITKRSISDDAAVLDPPLLKVIIEQEVKDAINDLSINISTISGDIPHKIPKQHAQIYSKKLTGILYKSIKISKFPDILKKADCTSLQKGRHEW